MNDFSFEYQEVPGPPARRVGMSKFRITLGEAMASVNPSFSSPNAVFGGASPREVQLNGMQVTASDWNTKTVEIDDVLTVSRSVKGAF